MKCAGLSSITFSWWFQFWTTGCALRIVFFLSNKSIKYIFWNLWKRFFFPNSKILSRQTIISCYFTVGRFSEIMIKSVQYEIVIKFRNHHLNLNRNRLSLAEYEIKLYYDSEIQYLPNSWRHWLSYLKGNRNKAFTS